MATPNPFLAIRTRLQTAFNPKTISPSNSTQITFISGLLGIVLLITLATLVIRVRKGSFWVMRWTGTHQGNYITPHPVNCYLIGSMVFLVAVQPYCYTSQVLLITLVWTPLFIARWCMNLSVILSLITEKSPAYSPTRLTFLTRPTFVNSIFLLFLLAFLSTLIPLSIDAHTARHASTAIYEKMEGELIAASIAFNAGEPTDFLQSIMRTHFNEIRTAFVQYNAQLRKVWIAWTTFAAIELLVFLISSSLYFTHLLASLRSVTERSSGSTGELRVLRDLVMGLIFSSASTLAVGGCHFAASVYLLVVEGNEDFATLLALWAFAIFGGASSILLLIRAYKPPAERKLQTISAVTISIHKSLPSTPRSMITMRGEEEKEEKLEVVIVEGESGSRCNM